MNGTLVGHLPAIYQASEQLGRFLEPFDAVLFGPGGIRDRILSLPDLLDPDRTPEEFLPWLASWVALSLRGDLGVDRRRALIANAVPLYVWRGTMHSVQRLLELTTGGEATVAEPEIVGLRVGVDSTIGVTTRLGRELPHYFQVTIDFPEKLSEDRAWLEDVARETIDLAKPAHTYYGLNLRFSGGQERR
jgi:phage tail-like protein